jgi:glycosyltransferase involved in cell wall biosynthesis
MRTLLVLSPWFPYPADNGSRIRIFHLIRELSATFHLRLVTGVQSDSPAETPPELAALCESVVRVPWVWHDGRAGGPLSALRALVSPTPRSILETPNPAIVAAVAAEIARAPDAVLVCELGMDAYLPALPPGLPAFLEGAEISGFDRAFRTASGIRDRVRHGLTRAKGARYWRRAFRRYRAITAASAEEAQALRDVAGLDGPAVVVIPNGADVAAYTPRAAADAVPGRLIYNGALTYGPNRDAVAYFAESILPLIARSVPDAHLIVTGRFSEETLTGILPNPRIQLTGYLTDLRPTLATATVCVVPLRSGGGTRLKIIEAWAAGIPVVSTTVGAAGLEGAEPGEHLLLADEPSAFADAVLSLLRAPDTASRLARNARALAEARYGWPAIGDLLTQRIAGESPAKAASSGGSPPGDTGKNALQ